MQKTDHTDIWIQSCGKADITESFSHRRWERNARDDSKDLKNSKNARLTRTFSQGDVSYWENRNIKPNDLAGFISFILSSLQWSTLLNGTLTLV